MQDYSKILEKTYILCDEGKTQEAMEVLFTMVHTQMGLRNYSECNDLLEEYALSKCPLIVGVGLLRATFSGRSQLGFWSHLHFAIEKQPGGPRLLRGLS